MSQIQVPKGWELVKLGDIGEYKYGYNGKANSNKNGKPYLRITDIDEDGRLKPNRVYVDIDDNNFQKCRLENNDIVIARTGATVGKSFLFQGDADFVFASYLIRFRFDFNRVIPRFLLYLLKSPKYWNFIGIVQNASAQPNVNATKMSNFEFFLPPLEIQKKIIQKLDYVLGQLEEKKKEILHRINKFDSEKIHSTYQNYLLNLAFSGKLTGEKIIESKNGGIQVPKGWELKEFHKLTKSFDGLRIPLNKSQRSQIMGDYPYYGASGQVDSINDYKFDGKFLLIAEDGENLNSRKKPIAFVVNGKFWVNNHAHVVQPNDKISIDFLCYYMNNLNIMNYAKKQSTRPKLNKSTLDTIPICYPDNPTQKKIVEILDKKFQEWEKYKPQIQNIEKQYQYTKKSIENISSSILNSAFSGKLVNQS